MVANGHFSRVDIVEMKDLIYRKIGPKRAEKYFSHLKRFLWLKLGKVEFDKCCMHTIGKENIPLHNLLIRSIARNACQAKAPSQKPRKVTGLELVGLKPLGKSSGFTFEETVSRIQEEHTVHSRLPALEDGEEVEQFSESPDVWRWSLVMAPLGVSVGRDSVPEALHSGFGRYHSIGEMCRNKGELPDTVSLRNRLQKKLESDGVGISLDCADVLNNSLDVFLKRLIEPCVAITGSRYRDNVSILGGQSNNNQVMSRLKGGWEEQTKGPTYVSMLDFRVSMESNPFILREIWHVQHEKVCHYAVQE